MRERESLSSADAESKKKICNYPQGSLHCNGILLLDFDCMLLLMELLHMWKFILPQKQIKHPQHKTSHQRDKQTNQTRYIHRYIHNAHEGRICKELWEWGKEIRNPTTSKIRLFCCVRSRSISSTFFAKNSLLT